MESENQEATADMESEGQDELENRHGERGATKSIAGTTKALAEN